MAEEYGVKLKVTADTAEAQREMDALLREKSSRVAQAVKASTGVGGDDAASARRAGREMGKSFEQTASRATGRAIGKALAGVVLHQGVSALFGALENPGGDNTALRRTKGTVTGALGTAVAGGMIAGPMGAAIGALVGGVGGLANVMSEERRTQKEMVHQARMTIFSASANVASSLGSTAQQRLLEMQGGREKRVAFLREQSDTWHARGQEAFNRLSAFSGDHTSEQFKLLQQDYARAMGEWSKAHTTYLTEKVGPSVPFYKGSEFTDAFAQRGLFVGAQVSVGDVNQKITEQQGRMVELLQRILDVTQLRVSDEGQNVVTRLAQVVDGAGRL